MHNTLKVFISSAMDEFKVEREAIIEAVQDMLLEPVCAERPMAIVNGINRNFNDMVKQSDIYLGIFGYTYSKATREEFEAAQQADKDIIVLVRAGIPHGSNTIPEVKNFIQHLKDGGQILYVEFSSTEDLINKVRQLLISTITQNYYKVKNLPKYLNENPDVLSVKNGFEFIDLTHDITPASINAERGLIMTSIQSVELPGYASIDGTFMPAFESGIIKDLPTNSGTHVDLLGHLKSSFRGISGKLVSDYPLQEHFIGPCVVLDFSELVENALKSNISDSNLEFNAKKYSQNVQTYFDIIKHLCIDKSSFMSALAAADTTIEELNGSIKFVLIHTGLAKYYARSVETALPWKSVYHMNPYFSKEVIELLADLDVLKGVGSDSLRLENPLINMAGTVMRKGSMLGQLISVPEEIVTEINSTDLTALHQTMIDNGIILIENLTNLDKIVNQKSHLFLAPPKLNITNSDTDMIVRAFALKYRAK